MACSIIFLLLLFSQIEAQYNEFNVKLIPKNFSNSSYNLKIAQAPLTSNQNYYLMEISIGTPPKTTYAELDTGSDLIWFQCLPCTNCYKQRNPMFDPKTSSTYTNIPCESKSCHQLRTFSCSQKTCDYTYSYQDDSFSKGVLAKETLTLKSEIGEPIILKDITFGCGHNNNGNFNDREMGLIGLGRGPLSLISQIGSSLGGNMFSQCLVPFNNDPSGTITSHMSFGKGSEVLGKNVVSTPMVSKDTFKTGYFVTLLGISVEKINLPYSNDFSLGSITKGNMLIDSGTPTTYLQEHFYHRLYEEVRKNVALEELPYDPSLGYQLCYRTRSNLKGPILKAHFEGGDVVLTPTQIFIEVKDGVFCFAFSSSFNDDYGIFGNYVQSNYLIGFDLDREVVSFKPMDCKKNSWIPTSSSKSQKISPALYCCVLVLILLKLKLLDWF